MKTLFLTFLFLAFPVTASTSFKLEATTEINGVRNILQSGDVAFSGQGFNFSFVSNKAANLTITANNQKIIALSLKKNIHYTFPDDSLIVLDSNAGKELFTFRINGKVVKNFTINHLKAISYNINKLEKPKANPRIVNIPHFEKRAYIDLSNIKSNSRSAIDKSIYKQLSKATIVIKSGDTIGAGVLIDSKGLFLTNWHIVRNATYVYVAFKPKLGNNPNVNNYYKAEVVRIDKIRDLALIKILNDDVIIDKALTPLKLAKIEGIEVGEDIFTVGHPAGYYYSFNNGIIGNILNAHHWKINGLQHNADYIIKIENQINDGNSGSAVVNKELQIIGLVTYSDTKGQNLNFAISAFDIKSFLLSQNNVNFPTEKNSSPLRNEKERSFTINSNKTMRSETTHAVDTLGNPIIIQRIDINNQGFFDTIMIDLNNNGVWDRIGYDKDGDGIIEKWSDFQ